MDRTTFINNLIDTRAQWDALIASPGSPYKSSTGMLRGIEFARTQDWPFTGT